MQVCKHASWRYSEQQTIIADAATGNDTVKISVARQGHSLPRTTSIGEIKAEKLGKTSGCTYFEDRAISSATSQGGAIKLAVSYVALAQGRDGELYGTTLGSGTTYRSSLQVR